MSGGVSAEAEEQDTGHTHEQVDSSHHDEGALTHPTSIDLLELFRVSRVIRVSIDLAADQGTEHDAEASSRTGTTKNNKLLNAQARARWLSLYYVDAMSDLRTVPMISGGAMSRKNTVEERTHRIAPTP